MSENKDKKVTMSVDEFIRVTPISQSDAYVMAKKSNPNDKKTLEEWRKYATALKLKV